MQVYTRFLTHRNVFNYFILYSCYFTLSCLFFFPLSFNSFSCSHTEYLNAILKIKWNGHYDGYACRSVCVVVCSPVNDYDSEKEEFQIRRCKEIYIISKGIWDTFNFNTNLKIKWDFIFTQSNTGSSKMYSKAQNNI